MKTRIIGLAGAAIVASSVAAASGIMRARSEPKLPVSVSPEVTFVRQVGKRVSSDVFTGRGAKPEDVRILLDHAERGGPAGNEAFWNLAPLRNTPYRTEILRVAADAGTRRKNGEAYAAISLMNSWSDPRWRPLAQTHAESEGEWRELFRALLEEQSR